MNPEARNGRNGRDGRNGGGFLKLVKAVFWSFFGVRRRADLENDAAQLKPLHLIAAGVIGAVVFIVVLLLVVRAVVG
ncbi:DUF2970 domain-containing protein [Caballeronia sp. LP006]|uniref:DUF2970 domain-containing protein n=1 Tax=unclassified Caballeronia TaxID=2646786 RepID=UPI001FD10307|nr:MULTISPECIES: DUF2970 domain-containing protein [unclassified Caballeronia]MDR5770392.1 DUF2970 domain-containing protein [Caballeronia sp. LZ002]MDR5803208.1 DUF2970 domain-containing protein [Caballeronia sp. LZ001]MDR5830135.1 DUF2970 domain-containing protein [Caballeronia sp. LP006]MDR5845829.1 DUF2970 domain-containing protein [Caballeronia sp. LZ003]